MIKVGILGASGYTANELVRLLSQHKEAKIIWLASQSFAGKPYFLAYPNFFKLVDLECIDSENLESLCQDIDVLFCATPHNFCANILTQKILDSVKVIDLSADFRLKNPLQYEQWYHTKHTNQELLKEAVYGLCELNREAIKRARLIANPGCYPTCSILSLAPLLQYNLIEPTSIIIDAKSGVSGAGRSAKIENLFCEVNENFKAYGIASHRHTPEIEQALSHIAKQQITLSFTPHLIPINRGILATIYATLKPQIAQKEVAQAYEEMYGNELFIRILPQDLSAQTRFVESSNFVDIKPHIDMRTHRVIITSAMDNLIKGAAGAAVQNMNILFGLVESSGLYSAPIFP